jgi:hypothetical protein
MNLYKMSVLTSEFRNDDNEEMDTCTATRNKTESTNEKQPDSFLDWDGHTDVGDPRNWSVAKKILHTTIPAL